MFPVAFGVSAQPIKHVPASPAHFGMARRESGRLMQHWTDLINVARLRPALKIDLSNALQESLENVEEPEVILEASTNFLLFLARHTSEIMGLKQPLPSNINEMGLTAFNTLTAIPERALPEQRPLLKRLVFNAVVKIAKEKNLEPELYAKVREYIDNSDLMPSSADDRQIALATPWWPQDTLSWRDIDSFDLGVRTRTADADGFVIRRRED